jgi:hypothetical protein
VSRVKWSEEIWEEVDRRREAVYARYGDGPSLHLDV